VLDTVFWVVMHVDGMLCMLFMRRLLSVSKERCDRVSMQELGVSGRFNPVIHCIASVAEMQ
jgi:hypothetical protein